MTRDELLNMALLHIDATTDHRGRIYYDADTHGLIAFANAIIERCAVMCDEWATDYDDHEKWHHGMGAMICAKGIRSMKAPTP